jgi:hypothetical protein
MDRDPEAHRTVTACVLSHLAQSPDAADTAEGIRDWWLTALGVVELRVVEEALEQLVRDGRLERATSISGEPVYRRARGAHPLPRGSTNENNN